MTTFVITLFLILTLIFTLSLYYFGFRANTHFFFINYGCPKSCQPNGCSNITPLYIWMVSNQLIIFLFNILCIFFFLTLKLPSSEEILFKMC